MLDARQGLLLLAGLVGVGRVLQKRKHAREKRLIREGVEAKGYSVGIIGGGIGGIAAAKKCIDLGIPFHIYEMAEDFGGTWLYNTYPGCGCDVFAHGYSFSWALNPNWTRKWVKRNEIFEYLQGIARRRLNLAPSTSFYSKVTSATFANNQWTLEVKDVRSGAVSRHSHAFVVCAVGQLNIPFIPDELEKTKDKFKGEAQFHSARWPANIELRGKRIACVGSGASAIQFAPVVAKEAKELIVFQRSPGWVVDKVDYEYPEWVKFLFRYVPFAMRLHRYYFLAWADSLIWFMLIPDSAKKPTVRNQILAYTVMGTMKEAAHVDKHDVLLPTETMGCKRLLLSDEWLQMFSRENVKLVCDPVKEITSTGVKTATGEEFKNIDMIIYGTGFKTGLFLDNLPIYVVDDKTSQSIELHKDVWKGFPQAFKGVTFDQMANFVCTYAPNTNVNHSTIISIIEAEVEHFGGLLSKVVSERKSKFIVRPEAHEEFNRQEQELLNNSVFNADCNSWYKRNAVGRILNNFHGSLVGFWSTTGNVNLDEYNIV